MVVRGIPTAQPGSHMVAVTGAGRHAVLSRSAKGVVAVLGVLTAVLRGDAMRRKQHSTDAVVTLHTDPAPAAPLRRAFG